MKSLFIFILTGMFCFGIPSDTKVDLSELNFEVVKAYTTEYPSIKIKNISIEPALRVALMAPKFLKLELTPNSMRQPNGMFSALYLDDGIEKRLFFRYRISAEIETARATRDIARDKKIESDDLEFVLIPLERYFKKSISREDISAISAKRLIKAGSIVTQADFMKTPLVIRNSSVVATVMEGELELDFEAVSIEDGGMGQMVTVKNKNGKMFKAMVIGPSRVRVR